MTSENHVFCLLSHVSCLTYIIVSVSPFSCLFSLFHVSGLTTSISCLTSTVLSLLPVFLLSDSCLLYVSCLLSISCLMSVLCHLQYLSHVSCLSLVSCLSHEFFMMHVQCILCIPPGYALVVSHFGTIVIVSHCQC